MAEKIRWRIIQDGRFSCSFKYRVEYDTGNGAWQDWGGYDTLLGARFALWRAKRTSRPVGRRLVMHQE